MGAEPLLINPNHPRQMYDLLRYLQIFFANFIGLKVIFNLLFKIVSDYQYVNFRLLPNLGCVQIK